MLQTRLLLSAAALFHMAACTPATNTAPYLPASEKSVACTVAGHPSPATAHGLDLFLHLAKQQQDNLCISPYSAHAALALVQPGARGETLKQIDRTIGHISNLAAQARTTALPFEIANRACIEQTLSLKPEYKQALPPGSYVTADFINQPDRERININQWVSDRTRGHIQNLIPQDGIGTSTRLALVNAIYTKAEWAHPFERSDTWNQTFHPEQGTPHPAPTLNATHAYRYIALPDCEAVAIPFQYQQDKQTSCLIAILPAKNATLTQYLATLTPEALQKIRSALATAMPETVKLDIPKFKFESSSSLSAALAATGMPNAFDPTKADFSGMATTSAPLAMEQVLQKCYFEMSEEGITATAATGLSMAYQCAPVPEPKQPPHFKADRPFIWIIADLDPETTPYFIGTLRNPTTPNETTSAAIQP